MVNTVGTASSAAPTAPGCRSGAPVEFTRLVVGTAVYDGGLRVSGHDALDLDGGATVTTDRNHPARARS